MYINSFGYIDATIANNTFGGVNATTYNACAMSLPSFMYIDADITGNTFTGAIDGGDNAYGMYLSGNDYVYADITGNTFGATIGRGAGTYPSGNTYGMYLISDGDIEAEITGNTLGMITSTNSYAYGLYLYAGGTTGGYIDADVSNNALAGVTGAARAYGIALLSYDYVNTDITDNSLGAITSTGDNAYGIYLRSAVDNIVAGIIDNTFDVTSTGNNAYGAYIFAAGLIGDITGAATLFQDNSGTIDGATARYMLYMDDAGGTSNSYVIWTGSSFTPLGGGAPAMWSGTAPVTGFGVMNDSINIVNYGGTINPN
jgi:hypothetical protein